MLKFGASFNKMILTLFDLHYCDILRVCFAWIHPTEEIPCQVFGNYQAIAKGLAEGGGKVALYFLSDLTDLKNKERLLIHIWAKAYQFEVLYLLLLHTDWQHDLYVIDERKMGSGAKLTIFKVMIQSFETIGKDPRAVKQSSFGFGSCAMIKSEEAIAKDAELIQARIDEYKTLLPLLLCLPGTDELDLELAADTFAQHAALFELAAIVRS